MSNKLFKKVLIVGIIILFIRVSVIPSNANFLNINITTKDELTLIPSTRGNTIYVDDDNTEGPWDGTLEHPYQNIQDGVDNAVEGDTVFVFNGTYSECIVISKSSIKLVGENTDATIIDGKDCYSTILIDTDSDYIHICKFTIKNGNKGIRCYSDYNKIYQNNISNNKEGIYICDCSNCMVYRNHIHNNTDEGIVISGSTFNLIKSNDIRNSKKGILYDSADFSLVNRVVRNNFINNFDNAIFNYLMFKLPNQWSRNYWDDWDGIGPKIIYGFVYLPDPHGYDGEYKNVINFDWRPARKPYDITLTDNIEDCGIE